MGSRDAGAADGTLCATTAEIRRRPPPLPINDGFQGGADPIRRQMLPMDDITNEVVVVYLLYNAVVQGVATGGDHRLHPVMQPLLVLLVAQQHNRQLQEMPELERQLNL